MFPEELFEAGYKLMAERWEIQQREESENKTRWHYFRVGLYLGCILGFGGGIVFCVIYG